MPPHGFGPEAKTRGGILEVPACNILIYSIADEINRKERDPWNDPKHQQIENQVPQLLFIGIRFTKRLRLEQFYDIDCQKETDKTQKNWPKFTYTNENKIPRANEKMYSNEKQY